MYINPNQQPNNRNNPNNQKSNIAVWVAVLLDVAILLVNYTNLQYTRANFYLNQINLQYNKASAEHSANIANELKEINCKMNCNLNEAKEEKT